MFSHLIVKEIYFCKEQIGRFYSTVPVTHDNSWENAVVKLCTNMSTTLANSLVQWRSQGVLQPPYSHETHEAPPTFFKNE